VVTGGITRKGFQNIALDANQKIGMWNLSQK
jgi:hypothetical protein